MSVVVYSTEYRRKGERENSEKSSVMRVDEHCMRMHTVVNSGMWVSSTGDGFWHAPPRPTVMREVWSLSHFLQVDTWLGRFGIHQFYLWLDPLRLECTGELIGDWGFINR